MKKLKFQIRQYYQHFLTYSVYQHSNRTKNNILLLSMPSTSTKLLFKKLIEEIKRIVNENYHFDYWNMSKIMELFAIFVMTKIQWEVENRIFLRQTVDRKQKAVG